MRNLRRAIVVAAFGFLMTAPVAHADAERTERVDRAREVFQDLITAADRAVPESLLVRTRAIAIFPRVLKAALGFGGRYGKGVVSCRDSAGQWSPPAFLTLTGGSWGLQIGAESAEVVLFFMSERGTRSLLDSKFTLGGKVGVAAGPVGRTAEVATDLKLDAEIYSYARSKGLFAGLSLEGARLAPDNKSIESFYGEPVSARALLFDHKAPRVPPAAEKLMQSLP